MVPGWPSRLLQNRCCFRRSSTTTPIQTGQPTDASQPCVQSSLMISSHVSPRRTYSQAVTGESASASSARWQAAHWPGATSRKGAAPHGTDQRRGDNAGEMGNRAAGRPDSATLPGEPAAGGGRRYQSQVRPSAALACRGARAAQALRELVPSSTMRPGRERAFAHTASRLLPDCGK